MFRPSGNRACPTVYALRHACAEQSQQKGAKAQYLIDRTQAVVDTSTGDLVDIERLTEEKTFALKQARMAKGKSIKK